MLLKNLVVLSGHYDRGRGAIITIIFFFCHVETYCEALLVIPIS